MQSKALYKSVISAAVNLLYMILPYPYSFSVYRK